MTRSIVASPAVSQEACAATIASEQVLAARSVFSEAPRAGWKQSVWCNAAERLLSFAAERGATVVERFYSADHVVSTADEKQRLGETARCGGNGKF